MANTPGTRPVEDTVPKVNEELAVGSDIEFQTRWWRMEHMIWILLTVLIVMDALGFFGRGPFAKAHRQTKDGSVDIHYERVERRGTPSVLTINFGPNAIHDEKARLWMSESLVTTLGNQRVVPQPASSVIDSGGLLYTFPITMSPASVEFALQPADAGVADLMLRVPGMDQLETKILVMP